MKRMAKTYVLSILLAAAAMAGDGDQATQTKASQPCQAAPPATEQSQVPAAAGMIYTTDQARGQANEVPEELREALANTVNTSSEGLREEVLQDGTVIVDLQGHFQSAVVATIGPDGKLSTTCVSSTPEHTCAQHPKATAEVPPKP